MADAFDAVVIGELPKHDKYARKRSNALQKHRNDRLLQSPRSPNS